MTYYVDFVYGGNRSGEPISFSTLPDAVTFLIEWFQLVNYIAKSFMSMSRIEQLINPNKLLMGINEIYTVYRVHSRFLSEDVIIWSQIDG